MGRARFENTKVLLFQDPDSIEHLARCGGVLSCALTAASDAAVPGATPEMLSGVVERIIREQGGTPILLGLQAVGVQDFPAAAAVCVNEIAVNGVPGDRELCAGDIVTIDSVCELNGFVTDAAVSVVIGDGESDLVNAARSVLAVAVDSIKPGLPLALVSASAFACAKSLGFDVVDEALVHGVGGSLHAPPAVFWDRVEPDANELLCPGMVLAVEPVVVERSDSRSSQIRGCQTEADGWSRRAPARAAFEERTVIVTAGGCRVLTPIPPSGPIGA